MFLLIKINKITLSLNDNKRIQLIISILKLYLTLMILQKKTQSNIIRIGRKFLLIHTEH